MRHSKKSGALKSMLMPFGAVCLILSFVVIAKASSSTDADITELRKYLDKMQSLSSRFTQTLRDETGEVLQESSGLTKVKRPGMLYWEIESPFASLTVVSQSTLWRYDIDLEQVSRENLSADLTQTPALLLSGNTSNIADSFTVSQINKAPPLAGDDGVTATFELLPIGDSSLFKALYLNFGAEGAIVSMAIVDDLRQTTNIKFSEQELNASIDDKVFDFQPPAGVDVIGEYRSQQ